MSKHSNRDIERQIDDSDALLERMHGLSARLTGLLEEFFEEQTGIPLPTITYAKVRQTDVVLTYSSEPIVDEYVNGARKLLNAAFSGEKSKVPDGVLDVVEVVARRILGEGHIHVGQHASMVKADDYCTAVFATVEKASAKDWKTERDFFVSYYAFLVFKPTPPEHLSLLECPMIRGQKESREKDMKRLASASYKFRPLPESVATATV